jgi:hypothetical protein
MSEDIDDDAKLHALREVAREGLEAIERGEYRRFDQAEALIGHLEGLARIAIEGWKPKQP